MKIVLFANLTNGIEHIERMNAIGDIIRFCRIQSTHCEQKLWDEVFMTLPPDFYMNAALENLILVCDCGAGKENSRAMWQGIELIKYVLNARWAGREYKPDGRAKTSEMYFKWVNHNLKKKTKKLLKYYGKFYTGGGINIDWLSTATKHDGDMEYYKNILKENI